MRSSIFTGVFGLCAALAGQTHADTTVQIGTGSYFHHGQVFGGLVEDFLDGFGSTQNAWFAIDLSSVVGTEPADTSTTVEVMSSQSIAYRSRVPLLQGQALADLKVSLNDTQYSFPSGLPSFPDPATLGILSVDLDASVVVAHSLAVSPNTTLSVYLGPGARTSAASAHLSSALLDVTYSDLSAYPFALAGVALTGTLGEVSLDIRQAADGISEASFAVGFAW